MGNMYSDSIYQWNIHIGCSYSCEYCIPSFQRQMKRQKPVIDKNGKKRGCQDCYDYIPHFHEERVTKEYTEKHFPETSGDEFIWVGSSGDISFIKDENMELILEKIVTNPNKTFFFQTKNPVWYYKWEFPKNVLLGITLESDIYYPEVSKAPRPHTREIDFYFVGHPRKVITIEPVLKFNHDRFLTWIRDIRPERIYIGYDTHKTWWMEGKERVYLREYEPSLEKTKKLILELKRFTKVKTKYMKDND